MTNIGVQPTKNSIRLTSSTGDHGTLPAATESSAGIATAEQVKRWNEAWQWLSLAREDGSMMIGPPPVDLSAYVTRAEVQNALQRVSQVAPPPAVQQPPIDITPRVKALESAIGTLADKQPQAFDDADIPDRVSALEEAVRAMLADESVPVLQRKVASLEDTLRKLYNLVSQDDTE